MKNYFKNQIWLVTICFIILSSCKTQSNIIPNITNTNQVLETSNSHTLNNDETDGNEILGCSPEKVYNGDVLNISFRKNHGRNFAVFNENTKHFYFVTAPNSCNYPTIPSAEFVEMSAFTMKINEVRSCSHQVNANGEEKSHPFFTSTGWYRVIIGHKSLEVDFQDMPITGSCRFYYDNQKK
jgi:hypothetical protein